MKYMIIFLMFLSQALTLQAKHREVEPGKKFRLVKGAEAGIKGTDTTIRLLDTLDSRCPKGVQCITAGSVDLYFAISLQGRETLLKTSYVDGETTLVGFGDETAYEMAIFRVGKSKQKGGRDREKPCKRSSAVKLAVWEKAPDVICTAEYAPVCAVKNIPVQCVTAPCPPVSVYRTYSNACHAEGDRAEFAFDGECGELEGQSPQE